MPQTNCSLCISLWNSDLPPAYCHSVRAGAGSRPSGPGPTQFNTTLLHLAERQKEDSLSTESSAQSCEMIGTVNAVTLLWWSQRCRGMERRRGEGVCVHVPPSTTTSLLPLFLLIFFFPPSSLAFLRSLVKDSSLCKFNQTAWIKTIIQFVYKASFIRCQAGAPLTIRGSLTPDLCRGHVTHLLHCSTRVFQAIIRRQGAKDAWWESYYSNQRNTETECKTTWPYQQTG